MLEGYDPVMSSPACPKSNAPHSARGGDLWGTPFHNQIPVCPVEILDSSLRLCVIVFLTFYLVFAERTTCRKNLPHPRVPVSASFFYLPRNHPQTIYNNFDSEPF